MADRPAIATSLKHSFKVYLLFSFIVVVLLLLLSWLFFLRSIVGRPILIEHSLLSHPEFFALSFNETSLARDLIESSPSPPHNPPPLDDEPPRGCDTDKALLRVFMYDLPSEFHFGLLDWKGTKAGIWPDIHSVIPHYPGGLNLQHSIEYWLTLDLLSSRFPNRPGPCTAVRVKDSREADVVFVPFFSSLSYNRHSRLLPHKKISRNKLLQEKLVEFLYAQEEWKRSGGRDHVILAHHPNSMSDTRAELGHAMLILSDFGRYPLTIANVGKDVIAPYRHVIRTFVNDSSEFDTRPTLMYFQGAIYRKDGGFIRADLYHLLKDEVDVHFSFGSVRINGTNHASLGMHRSKFCLNIAGDTPSSNRLFDAIASHCVPVIISDDIELPFEDVLDYSDFCIFVRTSDALKKGFLINLVRSIKRDEWTRMWNRLKEIEHHFEYQYPSLKDDAVQMIWQAVARKVPSIRLQLHRSRRFSLSDEWSWSKSH